MPIPKVFASRGSHPWFKWHHMEKTNPCFRIWAQVMLFTSAISKYLVVFFFPPCNRRLSTSQRDNYKMCLWAQGLWGYPKASTKPVEWIKRDTKLNKHDACIVPFIVHMSTFMMLMLYNATCLPTIISFILWFKMSPSFYLSFSKVGVLREFCIGS